jgi:hypothetical protein
VGTKVEALSALSSFFFRNRTIVGLNRIARMGAMRKFLTEVIYDGRATRARLGSQRRAVFAG